MNTAQTLAALHRPGRPLVLPNCWDVASAVAVGQAGFPAVATSSAAVAAVLGYPDGHGAPAEQMFAAAARIANAVEVPVTVDAEAGYGLPAEEFVHRLAETGAVGCNLEDTDHATASLVEPAKQADWLAAVRQAADTAGIGLVLNARIDVFLPRHRQGRSEAEVVEQACARATAYFAAGADCVFPIFASEQDTVARILRGVGGKPVNTTYWPAGLDLPAARELGVARMSLGAGLWRAADSWLREALTTLANGTLPY